MTPSQIATVVGILNTNHVAVGRAMVILLSYQTEGERAIGTTVESNGVGFSGATDVNGTYFAKWVLNLHSRVGTHQLSRAMREFLNDNKPGRALTGKFLDRAREIAITHRRQLHDLLPKPRYAPPVVPVRRSEFPATVRSVDIDPRMNRSYDELPPTVRYGAGV